ncbi:MAG: methyltransferase domain-containing protein [Myxococcales bacterium]|nr:methyltransferase domain-containing protein [Myxococcales bacterium]
MKRAWATQIIRTPLGELIDALRGEALLRLAPGLRVLDLGHGSAEIARWVGEVAESLTTVARVDLLEDGDVRRLPYPDDAFELTYCLDTLAHLGSDEESSERAVRDLLAEATRVTAPDGLVVVEIANPRSLRGAAHGIRRSIAAVTTGSVVVQRRGRLERYDTLSRLLEFAPEELEHVGVHGIRVFVAVAEPLSIPIVGRLLRRLEWYARDHDLLQRFGSHLLVLLRKGHKRPVLAGARRIG